MKNTIKILSNKSAKKEKYFKIQKNKKNLKNSEQKCNRKKIFKNQ